MESQILIKHEEDYYSLLASINQLPQSLMEHEELQFMEVKIQDIPIDFNSSSMEIGEGNSMKLDTWENIIALVTIRNKSLPPRVLGNNRGNTGQVRG